MMTLIRAITQIKWGTRYRYNILLFLASALFINMFINLTLASGALWHVLKSRLQNYPEYSLQNELFLWQKDITKQAPVVVIGESQFTENVKAKLNPAEDFLFLALPTMRLRNIAKALDGAQLGYSIKGIYVQNHPILWNNTLRVDTLVNTELWENVLHELSVKSLFGLFFNLDKRNWHLFFNSLRDWAKAPLKSIKPKDCRASNKRSLMLNQGENIID